MHVAMHMDMENYLFRPLHVFVFEKPIPVPTTIYSVYEKVIFKT